MENERDICDGCEWNLSEIIFEYCTGGQHMVKRYCTYGDDKCKKEYIEWFLREFSKDNHERPQT